MLIDGPRPSPVFEFALRFSMWLVRLFFPCSVRCAGPSSASPHPLVIPPLLHRDAAGLGRAARQSWPRFTRLDGEINFHYVFHFHRASGGAERFDAEIALLKIDRASV